jgi:digeranylgeranylglycerophospholipid reductase
MLLLDIIIIGGGPVGSEAAFESARSGFSVAVLEKRINYASGICCTGIVSLECLDTFQIDCRLVKRWFTQAYLFSPSRKLLHIARREPLAGILDRARFDEFMASRAQAAGAIYRMNATAFSLQQFPDRVTVGYRTGSGTSEIAARAVLIATGENDSFFRYIPGINVSGRDVVTGAQAVVEHNNIKEIEIYLGRAVAPDFFAWIVPYSEKEALAGLLSRQNTIDYLRNFLAALKNSGKIRSDNVDIKLRAIALSSPSRSSGKRLIIVGGAAGQVKPTTGGGIYFGLLAARIGIRVFERCFRGGEWNGEGLQAYEKECRAQLQREFDSGQTARHLFEKMSDGDIEKLFTLGKILGLDRTLSTKAKLSFDWHSNIITGNLDRFHRYLLK